MQVLEAIQESELPRTVLARDARLSPATLASWIKRRSQPRPNSVHDLADGLERRAAKLQEIAAGLRQSAEAVQQGREGNSA